MSLSAGEIAQIRNDQAGYFPSSGTLLRGTVTRNAISEAVTTWGTIGTAIPCRVMPSNNQPLVINLGGGPVVQTRWVITMGYAQAVMDGDRVVIAGGTFEVIESRRAESWLTAVRIDAVRLS